MYEETFEQNLEELMKMGLVSKHIVNGEVVYRLTEEGNDIAEDIAFEEGLISIN